MEVYNESKPAGPMIATHKCMHSLVEETTQTRQALITMPAKDHNYNKVVNSYIVGLVIALFCFSILA